MKTKPTFIERHSLLLFLTLTPLLSLAIPLFLSLPTELVPLILIFIPALMAVVLTSFSEGRKGVVALLKKLLQWRIGFKWYAITLGLALGLRLTMSLLAVLLGWIPTIQLNSWSLPEFIIVGVFALIGAVMEELGWRGYVLPKLLANRSAPYSALLIGVVWGVIHLGLILPGQMNAGVHWLPSILCIIGLSGILTWLYIQTRGNLLIPILFHAGQNYFVFLNGGLTLNQGLWLLTIVTFMIVLVLIFLYGVTMQRDPVKGRAEANIT
jgi:membrane protease YdiL (CAAX protease family)